MIKTASLNEVVAVRGGKMIASMGLPKIDSLHLANVMGCACKRSCVSCMSMPLQSGRRGMATSNTGRGANLMHLRVLRVGKKLGPEQFSAAIGQ